MTIMCERKECANLINGVCNQKKRSYSKKMGIVTILQNSKNFTERTM